MLISRIELKPLMHFKKLYSPNTNLKILEVISHSCPKKTNRNPFLSTSLFNYSRINHHSRKNSNFPPWKYLGLQLLHTSIKPTQFSFQLPNPLTLHSLQQFLGHLNWLCPILGIPIYAMLPFYSPHSRTYTISWNSSIW